MITNPKSESQFHNGKSLKIHRLGVSDSCFSSFPLPTGGPRRPAAVNPICKHLCPLTGRISLYTRLHIHACFWLTYTGWKEGTSFQYSLNGVMFLAYSFELLLYKVVFIKCDNLSIFLRVIYHSGYNPDSFYKRSWVLSDTWNDKIEISPDV